MLLLLFVKCFLLYLGHVLANLNALLRWIQIGFGGEEYTSN